MRKATVKKATGARVAGGTRAKPKTVGEVNRWMSANYAEVMEAARKNCVKLTGKPTLGGSTGSVRRRKSA